jgi:short-subunit dehydrogenase
MNLEGKTALITGASGGLGEAIAEAMLIKGTNLILTGRDNGRLNKLMSKLYEMIPANSSQKIFSISGDLSEATFRQNLRDFTKSSTGSLHILINNAGITAHGSFLETIPEVMRRTMEVNFFSPAELTRILLPHMIKTKGEKMIVYTSSPSGYYGISDRFAYSASKAAGNALMECLRMELKEYNIKTLIFAPGYTETNLRNSVVSATGETITENQAKGAKSPAYVAEKLIKGIEQNKRVVFTDKNGYGVYWLRVLMPEFLDKIILQKR